MNHTFGGDWTEKKLQALRKYLVACRPIFYPELIGALYKTWYVDALAGTGTRTTMVEPNSDVDQDQRVSEEQTSRYQDCSVKHALGLPSPLIGTVFIERSRKKADALSELIRNGYPSLTDRCTIGVEDANTALRRWCSKRDWARERAVVFLDAGGLDDGRGTYSDPSCGSVFNEGDVQVPVQPYEISFRAILPQPEQATNLLVPVCLSASHVAYSSVRVEPQYMMIGQAAGVAAALAVRHGVSVQQVSVNELQSILRKDGVILYLDQQAHRAASATHSLP